MLIGPYLQGFSMYINIYILIMPRGGAGGKSRHLGPTPAVKRVCGSPLLASSLPRASTCVTSCPIAEVGLSFLRDCVYSGIVCSTQHAIQKTTKEQREGRENVVQVGSNLFVCNFIRVTPPGFTSALTCTSLEGRWLRLRRAEE